MSAPKGTSLRFLGKSAVLLGASYYAGQWVMFGTNPETKSLGMVPSEETIHTLKAMETTEHKVVQPVIKWLLPRWIFGCFPYASCSWHSTGFLPDGGYA